MFFFTLLPVYLSGQELKLPIWDNPNSTLSITKDSNFLVTSAGSDRISWVKSDLLKFGSKIIKTNQILRLFECLALNDGVIISGIVFPKNSISTSPAWLLIAKLDSCLEPKWQKLICFKEIYLDTQIVNRDVFTTSLIGDEIGNLYIFVTNENSNRAINQPEINRVTTYIYKFSINGTLLFRKPIIERKHDDMSIKSVKYYQGNLYLCGDGFFPLNGIGDTTSSLYVSRGVIAKMDTSGVVSNLKIFEEEKYYGNFNYGLYSNVKKDKLFCSQSGAFFKDSSYRVTKELTFDLDLNTIKYS